MITTIKCPNCARDTAGLVAVGGTCGYVACPACAPTPEREPYDYWPAVEVISGPTKIVVGSYLRNGVCCLDPGDCAGPCGLAND